MGQKTNPTSLRLNKTNKRYNSAWYSRLHYSKLLGDDLSLRPFLEQVLAQAGVPRNLWSFSPIPKRGRGLVVYLSPDRSRGGKSSKLGVRHSSPLLRRNPTRLQSRESRGAAVTSLSPAHGVRLEVRGEVARGKPLRTWERRFLVHLILAQLVCSTISRSRALLRQDPGILQRAHTLSILHGGAQAHNLAQR